LLNLLAVRNKPVMNRELSAVERAQQRETEWTGLMRRANAGDAAAYERLLKALAPGLRAAARRGLARAGKSDADAEDVVQETLLAIHLKRHTWDAAAPLGPWVRAIARNKLIDALRRRGRRIEVPIDDFADLLPDTAEQPSGIVGDVARNLGELPERQRNVVQAIAVEGISISQTAIRLSVSEGAVRVALHRGLAAIAVKLRESEP
jgi:RNA polymerase sigma-70 factor (ECF subfamily)